MLHVEVPIPSNPQRALLDRSFRPEAHCDVLSTLGLCQHLLGDMQHEQATYRDAMELLATRGHLVHDG